MRKFTLKLIGFLFIAAFLSSCDDLIENDKKVSSKVLQVDSDDYTPLGVPVVMPNDNFVVTFVKDLLSEGVAIYCYNESGDIIWSNELPENPSNPVYHNGQLFFACKNYLYALDAQTGQKKWSYQLTGDGLIATKNTYKPCVASDGSIVVTFDSYLSDISTAVSGKMVCVSSTGTENWVQDITLRDNYYDRFTKLSAPLATSNGVYMVAHVSHSSGNFAILNKYVTADGTAGLTPAIYDDYNGCKLHCANNNGDIFISGNDDVNFETKLISLSASLDKKWEISFGDNYVANHAVIDKDGNLFIGVEDGYFHKYSPDGSELFSYNLQRIFVRGEMLIAEDGNVYKCLQGAEKLDPLSGESTAIPIDGFGLSDLSMLSNGTLVYAGMGEVYMVSTDAGGLSDDAQWGCFGSGTGHSSLKSN
ncbi:PQQ-binding-like beta-propeller repeat protein [Plebeiibacterium marinum]|uniref:PQQ-binding-like beta-propeller repeat protein n=1 Tax=Plebeiibacterium marinum TaxID=2992111 RepID=A0AAE3MF76_9BACT|nr:PQQ-binding-like beta-propeller repeat protein [Plebeiobacterium marinum]MCW3806475.1 PQQ-binding-like beta-propeller repeat protein [Plebeiobacterium marinum]